MPMENLYLIQYVGGLLVLFLYSVKLDGQVDLAIGD